MSVRHFDTFDAWDKFVHVWVVTFGLCCIVATVLCKIITSGVHIAWLAWIVGIPLSTLIAILALVLTFLKNLLFGHKEPDSDEEIFKKYNRDIQIAWITGCIAAVAALFAHLNPIGVTKDFSTINLLDAGVTALFAFGIYKRQPVLAFFLFLHFVFWKMPLWSELQPKSVTAAGMIMALIFWRGFRSILLLTRPSKATI